MSSLESLPLHDALVDRITLQWVARTVVFDLFAFTERGKEATPHQLRFTGVTDFHCPHLSPWGESFFLNSAAGTAGKYTLEMQSGDEITVSAASFDFLPT